MTSHPYQTEVDIHVYQGDDEDALKNILVGDFRIEGLTSMEDANEILCRMRLDLDGILEVAAVEKRTGKSKQIRIANALRAKSAEEIAAGRKRIQELYETRGEMLDDEWETTEDLEEDVVDVSAQVIEVPAAGRAADGDAEIESLLERSRGLLAKMHSEDREEAIDLHEKIETAMASGDAAALKQATGALKELLFFVEGRKLTRSIRVVYALVRAASAFLSTLARRPPEGRLPQGPGRATGGSFLRTVQRRRREPVPGLPGAFSRRAHLLALRRRPGDADAAGGEGLAIAAGSPAGAGRRRRGAGPGARHRGARRPRHREWRGATVARRVVEDCGRRLHNPRSPHRSNFGGTVRG